MEATLEQEPVIRCVKKARLVRFSLIALIIRSQIEGKKYEMSDERHIGKFPEAIV